MARLKPTYRLLVQLHYFEELTYAEIAARQQVPLGTVKARLFRCRQLLVGLLAAERE